MNKQSIKINSFVCANSAAIIALGWYVFCRSFYIPFPKITIIIFQSWFPAINLETLWSNNLLGNFLIGVITLPIAVWITVYLFTKIYKLLS